MTTNSMTMDAPDERRRLDRMAQGVIGKPLPRPDGPQKVTGTATYAAEHAVENCAHGVLVRATATGALQPIARADTERMPGVLDVFTGERFPAQSGAGDGGTKRRCRGRPRSLMSASRSRWWWRRL